MRRRDFLKATGGAAGATTAASSALTTGAVGTAAAQAQPDWGGWLEGVDGGFKDARGQSEVTVKVGASGNGGAFAFSPAGLWIDPGTTVTWEWTGNGGGHNVHAMEGADFNSDIYSASGVHFEHTFESKGIVKYQCDPHASLGMKGAVAVGDDVPTTGGGGGEGGGEAGGGGGEEEVDPEEMGVPFQAHFVGTAAILGIFASLVFTFFFLKYGTSPNTGYPEKEQ